VVVRGSEIYFANFGDHKIFMLPFASSEEVIDITNSLRDPFGKGLLKIGSSYIQSDQRFLLLTSGANAELKKEDVQFSLTNFNDLRIRNKSFAHPEAVGMFLLGVNVTPAVVKSEETDIQQMLGEQDPGMPELPDDMTVGEMVSAARRPEAEEMADL